MLTPTTPGLTSVSSDPALAPVQGRKGRSTAAPVTSAAPLPLKAAPGAKPAPGTPIIRIRPMARPAQFRLRHKGLILAFVVLVVGPIAATIWYLETRAADQFASTLGFTVRSEDSSTASDLLGGLGTSLGMSGGSRDSDILYEFIRSQELVDAVDRKLDLRRLYARHYQRDPVFGFAPGGTIEDLTNFWSRMVRISYDAGSGLMELRVLAFDPAEAKAITEEILAQSTLMINDLSAVAREDATRYASDDLDLAVERLKSAREAITAFRIENQIIDLNADIQSQMGLLNTLQGQLAMALIDQDLLRNSAGDSDPRLTQAALRIEVIEARIEEERQKFGAGRTEAAAGVADDGTNYATTVAEFERLTVDREFAEAAYLAALAAYDGARATSDRQSRYLAAYIRPTLAEKSEFPQRPLLIGIVALFSFLIWVIGSLVYYALRDRR